VRDLTRLELITEAVRAALEELASTAGHALEGLADDDWGRRYGRPVRLGKNPTFLNHATSVPSPLRAAPHAADGRATVPSRKHRTLRESGQRSDG